MKACLRGSSACPAWASGRFDSKAITKSAITCKKPNKRANQWPNQSIINQSINQSMNRLINQFNVSRWLTLYTAAGYSITPPRCDRHRVTTSLWQAALSSRMHESLITDIWLSTEAERSLINRLRQSCQGNFGLSWWMGLSTTYNIKTPLHGVLSHSCNVTMSKLPVVASPGRRGCAFYRLWTRKWCHRSRW